MFRLAALISWLLNHKCAKMDNRPGKNIFLIYHPKCVKILIVHLIYDVAYIEIRLDNSSFIKGRIGCCPILFAGFNMNLSFLKYFVNALFLLSLQSSLDTDGSFQINPHAAGG